MNRHRIESKRFQERVSDIRRKRKILIVEDESDLRSLLREYFESRGYAVEVAADGNEAISSALATLPDVILLDLVMPRLDGWETMGVLRSYPTTRAIPIVICTGSSEERLEPASSDGHDALVRKPCTAEEVEATIVAVLGDDAALDSDESDAG